MSARDDRGQTTLDFAVGTALFLLTVATVFSFVPTMVQPFDGSTQSDTVVANRIASDLAERTLSVGPHPYALDADCTVAFFDGDRSTAGCRFDGSRSVEERVSLGEYDHLRVEVRGTLDGGAVSGRLCWDDATGTFVGADSEGCDASLVTASEPRSSESVSTAVRVVSIDGRRAELVVSVW